MASYSNVTLTSRDGDLAVVIYLPEGIKPGEAVYYVGSRFEHGSMIGSIRRTIRTVDGNGRESAKTHVLYGTDMWRIPHNANWPEAGVGLASEFGVGDDGDFCNYRCGWTGANDVTNGVLGYREVRNGETFLKIGVGELVKGTCPTCDSTDDYKFNSPYMFARRPEWKLSSPEGNVVRLEHQAAVRRHGYRLVKEVRLVDNVLSVTSTLTNLGSETFSTAWYSHHFFSCDGNAIGPGYSIDMQLRGDGRSVIYEEPGTWSWATPLAEYAKVFAFPDSIRVNMIRALFPGVRIKTEFTDDQTTKGAFTLHACETSIRATIPELENPNSGPAMYAFNLYVERATFSPEPQLLIKLDPGQSSKWTQRLVIADTYPPPPASLSVPVIGGIRSPFFFLRSYVFSPTSRPVPTLFATASVIAVAIYVIYFAMQSSSWSRRHRRRTYNTIPDIEGS